MVSVNANAFCAYACDHFYDGSGICKLYTDRKLFR